jgi:toxin FitB
MYLLDTDMLLQLRGAKADGGSPLAGWAAGVDRQSLFMPAVALIEIERAALNAERRRKGGADAWRRWIDDQLLPAFGPRILPVDAAVASLAPRLAYAVVRDGIVAATALNHRLTLVTGRPAAFRAGKVKLFDPGSFSPEADPDDWREAARGSSAWLKTLFVRG